MEVELYKQKAVVPLTECSLKWWGNHEGKYDLSKFAKTILSIPSTSVPSERVFYIAGNIVTATRSALHPDIVDKLIFLKNNM